MGRAVDATTDASFTSNGSRHGRLDASHVVGPVWRYFGVELSRLPLLFLFIIFFMSDAGWQ
ncbi:MAG: hypothetical protein WB714_10420 [Candidatus Sulfotelmatobacter sp.]